MRPNIKDNKDELHNRFLHTVSLLVLQVVIYICVRNPLFILCESIPAAVFRRNMKKNVNSCIPFFELNYKIQSFPPKLQHY